MTKAIVVYMPVIHQGYLALIERHQPTDIVLLTAKGCKIIDETIADQLSRDIRCIPAEEVAQYLHSKFPALRIRIFDHFEYLHQFRTLIMPDEDISKALQAELPIGIEVVIDNQFLRWDWSNTTLPKEVVSDYEISERDLDQQCMNIAQQEAQKSSDFWRQVGAVVPLGNGRFLASFNKHLPDAQIPYVYGDMRLIMKPGERPEICGAIHAEKALFAQALQLGIVLKGKDIYVTTFPCLPCAQMIAEIGFGRLFFRDGYSNQNATEVLHSRGIKIVRVK